jgi:hypothetical protein
MKAKINKEGEDHVKRLLIALALCLALVMVFAVPVAAVQPNDRTWSCAGTCVEQFDDGGHMVVHWNLHGVSFGDACKFDAHFQGQLQLKCEEGVQIFKFNAKCIFNGQAPEESNGNVQASFMFQIPGYGKCQATLMNDGSWKFVPQPDP